MECIRIGTHVAVKTGRTLLGCLGGVVEMPDGTFGAVTAGHVVQMARGADMVAATATTSIPLGQPMRNAAGHGTVVVNERADIALVGPVEGEIGDITGDLLFVRDPTYADVNQRVWVHGPRDLAPTPSYLRDPSVSCSVFRVDGPGSVWIDGLAAIDAVTQEGDSGAPVVDDGDNVIGFVVGSDGVSTYVMPARRALHELEASDS